MKEKVFFYEAKCRALTAGLSDAAARVSALGQVVKAAFPGVSFGVPFLWALFGWEHLLPWYSLRQYLADTLLNNAAKASGLNCGPGWGEKTRGYVETEVLGNEHPLAGLSDDARLNRKLIELQCRKEANALLHFSIDREYLRAGVIVIDKDGNAAPAQDAAARLEDFCTLYAETKEQAAFVEKIERMQRAALELERAYKEACASLPAKGAHRAALEACAWGYNPGQYELTPAGVGTIQLTARDAAARALISYFDRVRDAAPKFYNRAGVQSISPAELFEITGGLAGQKNAPRAAKIVAGKQSGDLKAYPPIL